MSARSLIRKFGPKGILKHYGPGPHPGTGTEQTVHGSGGGVGLKERPEKRPEKQSAQGTILGIEGAESMTGHEVLEAFAAQHPAVWIAPDGREFQTKSDGSIWVYTEEGVRIGMRLIDRSASGNYYVRADAQLGVRQPDPESSGVWFYHGSFLHGSSNDRSSEELAYILGLTDEMPASMVPPPEPPPDHLTSYQRQALTRQREALQTRIAENRDILDESADPFLWDDSSDSWQPRHFFEDRIADLEARALRVTAQLSGPSLFPDETLPQREATGDITSATGKVRAKVFDTIPLPDDLESASTMELGQAIFEATIELEDGSSYTSEITDSGYEWVRGRIVDDESGETVGTFQRSNLAIGYGGVYNSSFTIRPEYQGRGIGTLFLAHWEQELGDAGFEYMELSAADIGRYAWIVSGYEPDDLGAIAHHVEHYWAGQYDFEAGEWLDEDERFYAEREVGGADNMQAIIDWVETYNNEGWADPLDLAMIGAGTANHVGKQIFLSGPSWSGRKYIGHYYKAADFRSAYLRLWAEWALTNPAAIEQDAPEWWKAVRALKVVKHYGPGDHPSGSPQSAHGKGGGSSDSKGREGKQDAKTDIDLPPGWPKTFLERLTRCYELSGKLVMLHDAPGTLVHGTIQGLGNPPIDHAWIELDDGRVYDAVLDRYFTQEAWDAYANPVEEARYTPDEARRAAVKTEHWGPWHEEVNKHYGPGEHPGTGTSQDVHGSGSDSGRFTPISSADEIDVRPGHYYHSTDAKIVDSRLKSKNELMGYDWRDDPDLEEGSFEHEVAHRGSFVWGTSKPQTEYGSKYIYEFEGTPSNEGYYEDFWFDPENNRITRRFELTTNYRGGHQPTADYGAPAHDLTQIVSEDIYDHPEWYMHPDSEGYRESVAFIRSVRGNPDAEVTIYRAVPKGVKDINPGDWVTPSREYAQIHGESNLNDDYDILERKVTAKEVIWPGDYLPEWGWFPDNELGKRLLKALRLVKHYGPGEHPGTGTPQTVHGADRSGFPEIDRLIEDFLKEPLGDWTTDECLIGDLTPEQAHGACQEIAEQFADFVNARAGERGYRAYATQTDLEEMGYKVQGEPAGEVLDDEGNIVPGHYFTHTVTEIYLPDQRVPIWVDFSAMQYGYVEHPLVTKHYGPGPHPGTGTPQAIHGEGGTQGQLFDPGPRARPTPRDFQKHDIWPTSTTHDPKIKQQTEDGIKAVFKRMQQDPRWEKAREEWGQLEEPSENELKMLREEAGRLTTDFHYYAMKLLGVEWGNYPTPYQVIELIDEGQILEINEKGPWADVDEFLLDYVGGEEFLRADQSGSVAWEPWTDEDGNVVVDREKNQILLSSHHWVDVSLLHHASWEPKFVADGDLSHLEKEMRRLEEEWALFEEEFTYQPDVAVQLIDEEGVGPETFGIQTLADETSLFTNTFDGGERVVARPQHPEDGPFVLRELWAQSSADDHGWSLAVQAAAAEEFGMEAFDIHSGHSDAAANLAEEVKNRYGTYLKVWLRAVYEETQEYLAELGWENVPLIRGMHSDYLEEVAEWQPIQADLNPLSSFTVRPTTARGFGQELYAAFVPREQVWGISMLGNGAISEQEVIILGGDGAFDGYGAKALVYNLTAPDGSPDSKMLDIKTLEYK